jgi:hypothetical protein
VKVSRQLALALLLGLLVRFPFWVEALRTPLDGDTAVIGLMARHPLDSLTMWGQPYGSPLDAWLAAPIVAVLGTSAASVRLVYFLLGLALVPVGYGLGRSVHPAAGLPCALLLAFPPPYFLLLSAMPPPFYPVALVLAGALLVLSVRIADRLGEGRSARGALVLLGALAGLGLWTHLMLGSVVLATGAYLVWRAGGRRRELGWAAAAALVTGAPLWWRLLTDAQAAGVIALERRSQTFGAHLLEQLAQLHRPLGGLLGSHVPLVADDVEHLVYAPVAVAVLLALTYGLGLIAAARSARSHPPALLLLGTAGLALVAFVLPARSGPGAIRFLTPLYLPLAALLVWLPIARSRPERGPRRALIVVLLLACLHLVGGLRLLEAWRGADRAQPPFLLVDLEPARKALESRGIRHAYASYGPAYRLTFESGERVTVSQPWNERFRHYPLPYLDEVRFAKNVAWVLTPDVPTDLPPPHVFEQALRSIGGRFEREQAGSATLYFGFVPPFDVAVERFPGGGAVGDANLGTAVFPPPTEACSFALPAPRALSGITLVAPFTGPRLPRSMDVEVLYADALEPEVVARRRRREERFDLRWVNGHPQYVLDHDLIAIPLPGRPVASLRVVPVRSDEPFGIAEVLLHPKVDPRALRPWAEWLPSRISSWKERRQALAARPLPGREDWYYRSLLADRHR